MSRQIPPTRGSLNCMCWKGYKGPTQEDLDEQQKQEQTKLPTPDEVVRRIRTVQLRSSASDCGDCAAEGPCDCDYWVEDDE